MRLPTLVTCPRCQIHPKTVRARHCRQCAKEATGERHAGRRLFNADSWLLRPPSRRATWVVQLFPLAELRQRDARARAKYEDAKGVRRGAA